MSKLSQKDYLKKYLSGDKFHHKKKKKKTKNEGKTRVKIIDDDVDIVHNEAIDLDEILTGEDAPQIVGIIDDRPAELKTIEDFRSSGKWKSVSQNSSIDACGRNKYDKKKLESLNEELKSRTTNRQRRSRSSSSKRNKDSRDVSRNRGSKTTTTERGYNENFSPRRRRNSRESSGDLDLRRKGNNRNCSEDLSSRRENNSRESSRDLDRRRKGNNRNSNEDSSPKRRKGNRESSRELDSRRMRNDRNSSEDFSPKRRNNQESSRGLDSRRMKSSRNSSEDFSPKRRRDNRELSRGLDSRRMKSSRNSKEDFSPKRRRDNRESSENLGPRRMRDHRESSRDLDSRRRRRNQDSDEDLNHKRNKNNRNAKQRSDNRDHSEDFSPRQRKHAEHRNIEHASSPPPKITLDGKKAGLQDAKTLKQESEKFRKQENELFKNMSKDISGKDAEIAVRSSSSKHRKERAGFNRDPEEEQRKMKLEQQKQEIYNRWGKGLKQIEDYKNKIADEEHEMSKPLARYSDDADLDDILKKQDREGDPMLAYMKRKNKSKEASTLSVPLYEGSFPENRFNIRPGYRWDGVDRSNGYEKRWFEVQNKKKAIQEEAYRYSTEDM